MSTNELKRLAERLLKDVQQLCELIDAGEPRMPASAVREMHDEICLSCKKKITKAEMATATRGCHSKCYARNVRAIKDGSTTDHELVEAGLLALRRSPGRKAVRPDRLPERNDPKNEA